MSMAPDTARGGRGAARAAMVLWVFVLAALIYGVSNTLLSAIQLFSG